jgi:hypothetical protein
MAFTKVITIDEASLGRVYQHVSGNPNVSSWGMMSGFRASNSKAENRQANKKLESDLRGMNLGFFKVEGHWKECQDSNVSWQECPPDKLKDSVEESYFIPNISEKQLLGLTKKYNQDAAVFGDKESKGQAQLLFKNGEKENIGQFNANKVSNAYSKMKGDRSFLFSKSDEKDDDKKKDKGKKLKDLLRKTISNPKTGNKIQVSTALQYDKNHPVYKLAQSMLKNAK